MTALRRPTFLILGAAKSGTSSLYHYLAQHPQVCMSVPKEPFFFEAREAYERGLDYYWQRYFTGWRGQPAAGEANTVNLFLPYVPARIRESLPRAKLVAILRNPVERAYSAWWMNFSGGIEPLPFLDALQRDLERIRTGIVFEGEEGERLWRRNRAAYHRGVLQYRTYLDGGYYAEQLQRYFALFDRDQMAVMLFDDLRLNPEAVVRQLWAFIGVDSTQVLSDKRPQNEAIDAQFLRVLQAARRAGLGRLPEAIKQRVRPMVRRGQASPPMDPTARRWLIEHFSPRNRALAGMLGRDLEAWNA